MGEQRKTVETFGKCYRLMYRVGATMGDRFFAGLWSRESDGLLSDFIVFLKVKGETLAQVALRKISSAEQDRKTDFKSEAKPVFNSEEFVRHDLAAWQGRVAQYQRIVGSRVEKILELLEIIKHVGQTDAITPLLLERELLKLRLAIMDSIGEFQAGKKLKGDTRQTFAKQNLGGPSALGKTHASITPKLSAVHREILDFIRSRGEQIQNTEIFARFGNIHRRTLKRKLSDLVLAGPLTRSAKGKKVHYSSRVAS